MDIYLGAVALGILYLIAIFLFVCGIMAAILITNYFHFTGWNWWFVFISLFGTFCGGPSIRRIRRSE